MSLILSGTDGLSDVDGSAATPAIRGTDANTGIFFPAADTIAFSEGGAEVARFDSSGNFGLGVTPSAWSLGKAIEVGYVGHGIWGNAINETILMTNAYYNSAWKYSANSQYATQYAQRDGQHAFYNAPQGGGAAAGTNITFTQAMTLDVNGGLGIGTTSITSGAGYKFLQVNGTTSGIIEILCNGTRVGGMYCDPTGSGGNGDFIIRNIQPGAVTFSTNSAERARIDSSGNLLVGGTTAYGLVTVARSTASSYNYASNSISNQPDHMGFFNGGTNTGSIQRNGGSGVSYVTTSDYRLKENIAPMTGALTKVEKLKPVIYTWKLDGSEGQGFIAHELAEVVPDCVAGDKDAVNEDGSIKPQGIDTSFLVATLTAAIQEQQALITQLQADVAALKGA
jgi:hypothetical protein